MTAYQELWWEQTLADHSVLVLLRKNGAAPCHQLHYLQMVTEKLGKAYSWRTGTPPKKSHASFVMFLRELNSRPKRDRTRISTILGFKGPGVFERWVSSIVPLAYDLERLAPALAGDSGPNPEYPWPIAEPKHTPISHKFDVWDRLQTGPGRDLLRVISAAILRFPDYG